MKTAKWGPGVAQATDSESWCKKQASIIFEQEKKKFFKIGSGDDGLFASILIRLNPKDDADYDSLTKKKLKCK